MNSQDPSGLLGSEIKHKYLKYDFSFDKEYLGTHIFVKSKTVSIYFENKHVTNRSSRKNRIKIIEIVYIY